MALCRSREVGLPEPQFTVSDGFVITIWGDAGQVAAIQPESIELWVLRVLVKELFCVGVLND